MTAIQNVRRVGSVFSLAKYTFRCKNFRIIHFLQRKETGAFLTRSGVIGNWRRRTPVREKKAFPIAAATGPKGGSPTPPGLPSAFPIMT